MVKRRAVAAIGIAIAIAIVGGLALSRRHRDERNSSAKGGVSHGAQVGAKAAAWNPDAAIAGTVRDAGGQPIAGARVCASASLGAPECVQTGADGGYAIAHLFPTAYDVSASAPRLRGSLYGGTHARAIVLAAGERRGGIDLVLVGGAVALTGTVVDINGGPIVGARVRAGREDVVRGDPGPWYPAVETDSNGEVTLWVSPGRVTVQASAEGYAVASVDGMAPGELRILMTPGGSIAGIVVDGSGAPVEGADVLAEYVDTHATARTDETGAFRITGLAPGRYDVSARAEHGYGRTAGSVAVGLGSETSGVRIELVPAALLRARVETEKHAPCPGAKVELHDVLRFQDIALVGRLDGTFERAGVLAGTYAPRISCPGYYANGRFPPVVVGSKDQTDLVWQLTPGATIRGHVRTGAGAPIERASIEGRGESHTASTDSLADGSYALEGLPPGTYTLKATTPAEAHAEAQVSITGTGVIERDLVVDDPATIRGVVVDTGGHAVSGIEVRAETKKQQQLTTTSRDGTFSIGVRPGTYSVFAALDWKHSLTDKQPVTVGAGETASVRLVIPAQSGTIRGRVVDAAGAPVADAWVTCTLATGFDLFDRITLDDRPVLTAADGTFEVTGLDKRPYDVGARRRGGGEVQKKGVEPPATVELVIAQTGSLDGTVAFADGTHPDELEITVRDPGHQYYRAEHFFHTGGAFTLQDVQVGALEIAARAFDGLGLAKTTLAPGEHKRDLKITLDRSVTVRGRVLDALTHQPLARLYVLARAARSNLGSVIDFDDQTRMTGADGRFSIVAPSGEMELEFHSEDILQNRSSCGPELKRNLTGDTDLGDVLVVPSRLHGGESGDVGFELGTTESPLEIAIVDAKGPAAAASIEAGDVISSIDGVTGPLLARCAKSLLAVPGGTTLSIGLVRGTTARLVVGKPE